MNQLSRLSILPKSDQRGDPHGNRSPEGMGKGSPFSLKWQISKNNNPHPSGPISLLMGRFRRSDGDMNPRRSPSPEYMKIIQPQRVIRSIITGAVDNGNKHTHSMIAGGSDSMGWLFVALEPAPKHQSGGLPPTPLFFSPPSWTQWKENIWNCSRGKQQSSDCHSQRKKHCVPLHYVTAIRRNGISASRFHYASHG